MDILEEINSEQEKYEINPITRLLFLLGVSLGRVLYEYVPDKYLIVGIIILGIAFIGYSILRFKKGKNRTHRYEGVFIFCAGISAIGFGLSFYIDNPFFGIYLHELDSLLVTRASIAIFCVGAAVLLLGMFIRGSYEQFEAVKSLVISMIVLIAFVSFLIFILTTFFE